MNITDMTAWERTCYAFLGTILLLVYMIPEKVEVVRQNTTVQDTTIYNTVERDSLVVTRRESTVVYSGIDTVDSKNLKWVSMTPTSKSNTFAFRVPIIIDKRPDWGPDARRDAGVSIVGCDYWECNDQMTNDL